MPLHTFTWRPRWFIDDTVLTREGTRRQGRKSTYRALELGSNNFSATLVAASGFFTSSYLLYTSNNILPMLAFIYWHDDTKSSHETAFIDATTAGCIFGMLFFGICSDIFGRRKMYGFDTILMMIGTIGVVMSSTGYTPRGPPNGSAGQAIDYGSFGSMNIQAWLLFWRVITGIGVGGDYPCSAVIVSEFATTSDRPQMLAIVFAMQTVGNASGAIVSLVVTKIVQARHPYDYANPEASARAVDQIWRWVIGLSLIPALFTTIMRFTIPESPRYTLDVRKDPSKAWEETERLQRLSLGSETIDQWNAGEDSQDAPPKNEDEEAARTFSITNGTDMDDNQETTTLRQYFWTEGNWRYLFATSFSWFLLDVSTNALGLNQAQNLSKFWYGPNVLVKDPEVWDSDTVNPKASIFSILESNSIHLLAMISAPGIVGSVLLIVFITRVNRRLLTWVMFIVNGSLIAITGVTLLKTSATTWGVTIVFWVICNFFQQFGVGPLTFLIPAELFPTRYRTSCYGISAASGKLGTILGSMLLRYATFGKVDAKITPSSSPLAWLGYVLTISAVPLFLAAAVCWLWLPELQDSSGKPKTLESLAEGRQSSRSNTVEDSNS